MEVWFSGEFSPMDILLYVFHSLEQALPFTWASPTAHLSKPHHSPDQALPLTWVSPTTHLSKPCHCFAADSCVQAWSCQAESRTVLCRGWGLGVPTAFQGLRPLQNGHWLPSWQRRGHSLDGFSSPRLQHAATCQGKLHSVLCQLLGLVLCLAPGLQYGTVHQGGAANGFSSRCSWGRTTNLYMASCLCSYSYSRLSNRWRY